MQLFRKMCSTICDLGLSAPESCDSLYFPNIYKRPQIFCTSTVSAATAERSF